MSTRAALGNSLIVITLTLAAPARAADKLSTESLNTRLAAKPTGDAAAALAEEIRAWFGKDRSDKFNVATGANPKVEGLVTAWSIEAPGAKTAAVRLGTDKSLELLRVGDTPVFAGVFSLAEGSAFRWSYETDGKQAGRRGQLEVYTDAPELAEMPGVPKGKLLAQKPWESKIYPHTSRPWWIYVPAQYKEDQPACVMVFQDGGGYTRSSPRFSTT